MTKKKLKKKGKIFNVFCRGTSETYTSDTYKDTMVVVV